MARSASRDFSPVQLQGIAEMFASLADRSRLTILNTLLRYRWTPTCYLCLSQSR